MNEHILIIGENETVVNMKEVNINYLDPGEAWRLVSQTAKRNLGNPHVLFSPRHGNGYLITDVREDRIRLQLETTSAPQFLSRIQVERAIEKLNAFNGSAGKTRLIDNVARETALVFFHPNLKWSDDFRIILADSTPLSDSGKIRIMKDIAEAPDDLPEFQLYARMIRAGQGVLRKKLLEIYSHRCCITGTGPDNVLEAAHIEPHALRGNNNSLNSLLLRSDIHNLFDDGLIAIHPGSLTVYVHSGLKNTVYSQLNGKIVASRADGLRPDFDKLTSRWLECGWTAAEI